MKHQIDFLTTEFKCYNKLNLSAQSANKIAHAGRNQGGTESSEKLTVSRLAKKFSALNGNRRFTTAH